MRSVKTSEGRVSVEARPPKTASPSSGAAPDAEVRDEQHGEDDCEDHVDHAWRPLWVYRNMEELRRTLPEPSTTSIPNSGGSPRLFGQGRLGSTSASVREPHARPDDAPCAPEHHRQRGQDDREQRQGQPCRRRHGCDERRRAGHGDVRDGCEHDRGEDALRAHVWKLHDDPEAEEGGSRTERLDDRARVHVSVTPRPAVRFRVRRMRRVVPSPRRRTVRP